MAKIVTTLIAIAALMLTLAITNAESENSNFTIITGTANQLNTALDASDLEKLRIAAKTGESHIVNITDSVSSKLVFAQERVALSLDCLPLMQQIRQIQNGKLTIQWFFRQFSETGIPFSHRNRTQLIPTPPDRLSFQRIIIGGESDRWLNITQTIAVPGAEDPDNKQFICRILTPNESVYYESTLDLRMVGAPPVIIRGNGSVPVEEHGQTKRYHIGAEICISRNSPVIISLACQIPYGPPLPYPNPNRTWTKDGIILHNTEHGKNPNISGLLNTHILLKPDFVHPTPYMAMKDGSIMFSTKVSRISSPTLCKEGYSSNDARDDVFEFVLGTWTCDVKNSYGTDVVSTVITDCDPEVLSPPIEVQGYCSHINWRNSPYTSCKDIGGYDVRLYNPDTGLNVTRRVNNQGTFYNLLAIDEALQNDSTFFQVRVVSYYSLSRVGPYSSPAKLGCPNPKEQPIPPTTLPPTTPRPQCGGPMTTSSGTFQTPNWPETYPNNIDCEWRIQLPDSNKLVEIKCEEEPFGIAGNLPVCDKDYLKFYDGHSKQDTEFGPFCHFTKPSTTTMSSNKAMAVFHSGPSHSSSRRGFKCSFQSIDAPITPPPTQSPQCGGALTAASGSFQTPNWPETYPVNVNCTWTITLPDSTKRVEVDFESQFGIAGSPPTCKDKVYVYDDNSGTRYGPYCYFTVPNPPTMTSYQARVVLQAGPSHSPSRLGFSATYRSVA